MVARIIFFLTMAVMADARGPWLGTWQLNPGKSQTASDRYKRVVSRIEPWEDGLKVSYDMIGVRGGVTHLEWVGKLDGNDYPVEGADYIMTNAYTLLTDHTYQIVVKVEGNLVQTAHVEVSPDGKTLTTVTTSKDAHGETSTTTSVYERQN